MIGKLLCTSFVSLLALTNFTFAQQQGIEWKQTLNIPKGQNLSRERADILGIEIGDTYAEAKAKLQKLVLEAAAEQKSPRKKLINSPQQ